MPTILRAEEKLYQWLSQHKTKITDQYSSDQLRSKRKQLLQLRPELGCDLSAARRLHLQQLANEFNYDNNWVDTAFDVFYQARQQVNLFDDVLPVLSALKNDFVLVALTNGNAHIQHVGLTDFFDFQLSASDVKALKPDPAMFVEAMKQAGVSPEQTLHVGDHPLHDLQGAKNAGIDAVWIRRFEQVKDSTTPAPKQQVVNLYEFQEWLSGVSKK